MARKRQYKIFSSLLDVEAVVIDTASPFLEEMARNLPREFDRALKSAGWWISREGKQGIRAGAPGGQHYAPFSRLVRDYEKGGRYSKIERDRRLHPLGQLANAFGYQFRKAKRQVVIGWLSASAMSLAAIHEAGKIKVVTPKMRRLFAVSGFTMAAGKDQIIVPKRSTIPPLYRKFAPLVPEYIEMKIWGYVNKLETKVSLA